MRLAEIEHSILPPAAICIQFFNIQYFYLTFAFNFADLDPPWCLPGSLPGRFLVFTWSQTWSQKTFNFEGTKTSNPWNEGLTSDSEGSKSQKSIQFPADQVNPGKKHSISQVLSRRLPGVSRCPGKKKGAEAPRFTSRNLRDSLLKPLRLHLLGLVSRLHRAN